MYPSLELLVIVLLFVFPAVISSLWEGFTPPTPAKALHPLLYITLAWVQALGAIALVVYLVPNDGDGLASIGIQGMQPSVFAGWDVFVWTGFVLVAGQVVRAVRRSSTKPESNTEVAPWYATWLSSFDSGWPFAAFLSIVPWQVVAEELIYRGYLILLWGARTGAYEACAVVSVCLFVAAHLYQGKSWNNLLQHLAMAMILSAVTLLYKSIIPAVFVHLVTNLMFYLQRWPDRAKWKVEAPGVQLRVHKGVYAAILATSLVAFYSGLTVLINTVWNMDY